MSESGPVSLLGHILGLRAFPASFAWFLEAPWRRLVLSPAQLARRLRLPIDATVCEIGIGGGYYARPLSATVKRLLGVDLQAAMLRRVRAKAKTSNIFLVQAEAGAIPLASASVDAVIAITVMGEVPQPAATAHEVARILRPGGLFSVSEHVPDPDFQSFRRIARLCADAGLHLEECFGPPWSFTANFRSSGFAKSRIS